MITYLRESVITVDFCSILKLFIWSMHIGCCTMHTLTLILVQISDINYKQFAHHGKDADVLKDSSPNILVTFDKRWKGCQEVNSAFG